jgi:DNA-binding transcriptional MerR regulator
MLRHYDAIGLLQPAYVDRETGYRSYDAGQLSRLNRIVALKGLGFTLQQVQSILDEVSVEELRGMLRLRQAELHSQIASDTARHRVIIWGPAAQRWWRACRRGPQQLPIDEGRIAASLLSRAYLTASTVSVGTHVYLVANSRIYPPLNHGQEHCRLVGSDGACAVHTSPTKVATEP